MTLRLENIFNLWKIAHPQILLLVVALPSVDVQVTYGGTSKRAAVTLEWLQIQMNTDFVNLYFSFTNEYFPTDITLGVSPIFMNDSDVPLEAVFIEDQSTSWTSSVLSVGFVFVVFKVPRKLEYFSTNITRQLLGGG